MLSLLLWICGLEQRYVVVGQQQESLSPAVVAAKAVTGWKWNLTGKCPSTCQCRFKKTVRSSTALHTVDCSKRYLREIPVDLPSDTEALILQHNDIDDIATSRLSGLTQLRQIDLSYNRLSRIEWEDKPSPFQNMTLLQHLNLDHNVIHSLSIDSLPGMKSLQNLILMANDIKSIHRSAFRDLIGLRTLSLAQNKLTRVNADWFKNLTNLELILLNENRIKEIPARAFIAQNRVSKLLLTDNVLSDLDPTSFVGLEKLQTLQIDQNSFQHFPTEAMTIFKNLNRVTFDKNPLFKIKRRGIEAVKINELRLNSMDNMFAIDNLAFYNLPDLTVIHIRDNRKLTFIDPEAFFSVPDLREMYLYNNNLISLSDGISKALPSLQSVFLYDNPIHCDCNVRWIRQIMDDTLIQKNTTTLSFPQSDQITCYSPLQSTPRLLKQLSLEQLPVLCPPTVVPFFNDSYQKQLGDTITYECRAVGLPVPHVHWILANGKIVNNTSNFSRIRLDTPGTMTIAHLKPIDAGTYTCVATNDGGYDTSSSVLRVHDKNIHILRKGVATNFVTVTWNGTSPTITTSDYLLLFRKLGSKEDYGSVSLRPYMRAYTFGNLKPQTTYQFCIAYRHKEETVKLSCIDVTTKHSTMVSRGITGFSRFSVAIGFACLVASGMLLCFLTLLVRRHRRRKSYKEPAGINVSAGPGTSQAPHPVQQKVSTMSQIPLDNLYNPPSTPLCTSQTCLITSSNAWGRSALQATGKHGPILTNNQCYHGETRHVVPLLD